MRNLGKVYETKRLLLKGLEADDAELVLDYLVRNKNFLEVWENSREFDYYTIEAQEKLLLKDFIENENENLLRLWIFKKEDDRKIIGSVGFSNIVKGSFLSCHLGYKLDGNEINQGLVTEAIRKGIDIIFNEFKLHRIEANIMPKNLRSLRVVEKLGFYNEGLAYKYLKINGKWEDHIHMVLLNDEV